MQWSYKVGYLWQFSPRLFDASVWIVVSVLLPAELGSWFNINCCAFWSVDVWGISEHLIGYWNNICTPNWDLFPWSNMWSLTCMICSLSIWYMMCLTTRWSFARCLDLYARSMGACMMSSAVCTLQSRFTLGWGSEYVKPWTTIQIVELFEFYTWLCSVKFWRDVECHPQ